MPKFYFSKSYERSLSLIEDFIFESTKNIRLIEEFLNKHDEALSFIAQNPTTPAIHPSTCDQSWIFGEGRYRMFFKVIKSKEEVKIYLIHIIDNRQANLKVYPNNTLPTYFED